ncbi:tetratricopeptide repeat protein 16 isoform X2 [Ascaphus truei]|uniref:tetratricopeptide repeat protein 16 isoform X2 n=1 Tax=Ascaphus truei TaxID=8439 RepID=UPI003F59F0AB
MGPSDMMAEKVSGTDPLLLEEVTGEQLFPTAVSEEKLDQAWQKSHRRIFGSSQLFLHLEGRPHRPTPFSLPDIVKEKVAEHYKRGVDSLSREEWDKAVISFSKAINLDPDTVELYVKRAEAFLQLCDFQSVVLNLRRACSIALPREEDVALLSFTLYLQGQCLFEQGSYLDALESFTRASELQPWNSHYHMRSISCLAALGQHADCIRLVSKQLEEKRQNPDLYVVRARLYGHLSKPTLSFHDVQRALALEPQHPEARVLQETLAAKAEEAKVMAVNYAVQGQLQEALRKICIAIEHNPSSAGYHILRGTVYRRLADFSAAVDDYVLAMQLCSAQGAEGSRAEAEAQSQLLLTYNDFAVHCYMKGFYEEGTLLLNKALKGERNKKELYINRGDCFFQLGELSFALADYQQALELDPSDWGVRTRIARLQDKLGLQAQQRRQYQQAELHFSEGIKEQPLLPQLYLHRARVRRCLQNTMDAQVDAVIAILLDSNNDEAVPIVMNFFPGKTLPEILSSKLSDVARCALERSRRDVPASWNENDHSLYKLAGAAPATEAERKPGVALCVANPQLCAEMSRSRRKINAEIHKVLNRRGCLQSTAPQIHRPPPAKVEESSFKAPYHWRTFGIGLTHP